MGMKRFSAPPALGSHHPPSHQPPPPLTDDVSITFPAPSSSSSSSPSQAILLHHHHHQHHHHAKGKGSHPPPSQQQQQQQQSKHQQFNNQHHKHSSHQHKHHTSPHHHHHQHHHHNHLNHHHHHHHHLNHLAQHDTGKRVKTEQTFESLFDTETHSDVTVNVNGDEYLFHAHRMVLAMKSEVFAAMLTKLDNNSSDNSNNRKTTTTTTTTTQDLEIPGGVLGDSRAVLHVHEDAECSQVFSRFLYFLYSGSVWLHPDYVLPLCRLAHRYQVRALKDHCQSYILQVLAKSCHSPPPGANHNNNNTNSTITHNHCPSSLSLTPSPNANSPPPYMGLGFSLDVVCDIYEDEAFEGDVRQTAHRLLCCQFRQLVRSERWPRCSVASVCGLISGDGCNVEENVILMAATDFMKKRQLSDKKQIEDILSHIRYPRLNRRVLYHLQKNGSFQNFPHIQDLMVRALMFHSFRDLPEAKDDFRGTQFRPRMSSSSNASPNRRASMHVATCGLSDGHPEEADLSDSDYSLEPLTGVAPVTAVAQIRQSQV
ncbi:uncharacterized protein LOC143293013 [Babylonia areolata]|uniref:uncharacterized protein LOC143293013 n=1 Tax=Babylonia areolata TaxID=304850 RepID=UPI003FD091F9